MSRQRQAIGSARQRLKSAHPVTAFGCLEIQDHFCLQLEAVELEQSTTRPPVDQKTSASSQTPMSGSKSEFHFFHVFRISP
mmetsp:Transcript_106788/g.254948  ORF Transcript_106788/g.254948 Transcript_106788/m.254948 type:complete len:81 (-) Transcript_106788:922-1164(-)